MVFRRVKKKIRAKIEPKDKFQRKYIYPTHPVRPILHTSLDGPQISSNCKFRGIKVKKIEHTISRLFYCNGNTFFDPKFKSQYMMIAFDYAYQSKWINAYGHMTEMGIARWKDAFTIRLEKELRKISHEEAQIK